jgi:hypothetical protein
MPDTLIGVLIAIALVLPGFVIVQLSRVGRATADESEVELVLRALFYALLLHAAYAGWTSALIEGIPDPEDWPEHLRELLPYVATVLIATPVVIGTVLGRYLRNVERAGKTGTLSAVLGAKDARDAFDYLFQRLDEGGWLIVELTGNQFVGGKYGKHSSVGQSPSPHDLCLQ